MGCLLLGGFIVAIDSSKQQALDADPTEQINFTGNLENQSTIFFITEEVKKKTVLDFSQGTVRVVFFLFLL